MTHRFEVAGLGTAPFKCVGYFEAVFQACPGAPVQPGTSCDYCGQGIRHAFRVRASDGREFKVGSDCIARVGDAGLIRQHKTTPEYRAAMRAKSSAKSAAVDEQLGAILPKVRDALASEPHPAIKGKTNLDYAEFILRCAGAAGRAKLLKALRSRLAMCAA